MNSIKVKNLAKKERNSFTDGDWIEAPFLTNEGIRLIQTGNIGIGKFKGKNEKYISEESFKKLNCKEIFPNDILICRLAEPIGRAIKVPNLNNRLITSVDVTILRVDNKFDKDFILHKLNSEEVLAAFLEKSGGSTRQRISRKNLGEVELLIPEKPFQEKIGRILSTIDSIMDKTKNAITKYQSIKKGMMHDLFTRGIDIKTGRLRPSFDDAPELYKESVLGMIPKDWTLGKLIDSASTEHYSFTGGPFGSDLQTKDYTDTGVQVIQLQNIGDGEFINKSIVYTSTKKANELRSCNIYPNDIIIAKMAYPVARACIIPNHAERFVMASDGIRLKVDSSNYNTLFVKESINNKYFRTQAVAKSTGTTRERIGLTELKNIKVKYPQFKEQNAIAERIESIDSLIRKEQKTLAKNEKIKKGLMQDLLSGKVEVKV